MGNSFSDRNRLCWTTKRASCERSCDDISLEFHPIGDYDDSESDCNWNGRAPLQFTNPQGKKQRLSPARAFAERMTEAIIRESKLRN